MKAIAAFLMLGLITSAAECVQAVEPEVKGPASPSMQVVPKAVYTARDTEIQSLRDRLSASNPQLMEARMHRSEKGRQLPYRLFKPAALKADEKYPLVLVLHGSGSRGLDNLAHITGQNVAVSAGVWTLPENQKERPCFVLAPQCPPHPGSWTDTQDWGSGIQKHYPEPTSALASVVEILDAVSKEFPVDTKRVYVVGASMGGYGTWDLLVRHPDRFAAAVPVCGALAEGQAARVAKVPVWIFHGGADKVVPVSASRSAYEQLRLQGGRPRYTEYDEAEHRVAVYAFTEPGIMEWLFAQRKEL